MRLDDQKASSNVEDRRGRGGGRGGGGLALGNLSFGTIVLLAVFAIVFRVNPLDMLSGGGLVAPSDQPGQMGAPADRIGQFTARVLGSTETTWTQEFAQGRVPGAPTVYAAPTLVLFDRAVSSGCGGASAAMGPFYCPLDQKLYLDTSFFNELSQRFGAPGDFAQAYVIAHEVGHHVQKLTGVTDRAMQAQKTMGRAEYNQFSVKMELQADCYAGVWGHNAGEMNQLSPGDIEEALTAASAIGDDKLQQQSQGRVVPDSFTHGSAEQRMRWFRAGFDSGDPKTCDTFNASRL